MSVALAVAESSAIESVPKHDADFLAWVRGLLEEPRGLAL
jgi:hypothetical protein